VDKNTKYIRQLQSAAKEIWQKKIRKNQNAASNLSSYKMAAVEVNV
jgi:hypothetical protein